MWNRYLLLFGLMLGVAAAPGANEARAVVVLDTVRSVVRTAPDSSFVAVGFKRHGFHRAPDGGHKQFRGPSSFAGKRFGHGGVVVRKDFVGPGLFKSKHFRTPGVSALKRLPGPRFLPGTRPPGGMIARKQSIGPRLFFGKRFGAGGVGVRSGSQPFFARRFRGSGVVVSNGSGSNLFVGKRFGERGSVLRHGFVGPQ